LCNAGCSEGRTLRRLLSLTVRQNRLNEFIRDIFREAGTCARREGTIGDIIGPKNDTFFIVQSHCSLHVNRRLPERIRALNYCRAGENRVDWRKANVNGLDV
jgi:hypothetical protein